MQDEAGHDTQDKQAKATAQGERWSQLMAAAQDGDTAAYELLLRAIAPFIRNFVRRDFADVEVIEDIVQETLLTVHRVRHSYDPRRPFTPWLCAIAGRRAVDALRQRQRIHHHETQDELAYTGFADETANPEEVFTDLGRIPLQGWLQALPARQRQALELLKLRELSLREAAAASGQSTGALKVSVHRAMQALRARARRKPA